MSLAALRQELSSARTAHSAAVARASTYVKGGLVVGGAAIAGLAQFATWPAGGSPDAAQIIGMAATVLVAIGGFYVLATEKDGANALEVAEKAIDRANAVEAKISEVSAFFEAYVRLAQTYQSCLEMRGALEQASVGSTGAVDQLVTSMFEVAKRSLEVGIGFPQADSYTLGVYKAVPGSDPGKAVLRCVAQKRAIECTLEEAREWPEGVGIAGIAYSHARDIILPDLGAEGIGAIFGPRDLTRPYDADRYVSMVATPVTVAGRERPWGVVVATSDREGFFTTETVSGFKTDEPVRALAAFIALAVAINDAQDRARASTAPMVSAGSPAL